MPLLPPLGELSIAVIIVNYRAADLVVAHLPAVLAELEPFARGEVIVIDNASPSDDGDKLAQAAQNEERLRYVAAPKNGGFAYGNNRGLEAAGAADLYFFLNPDAKPRPGALAKLAETLLGSESAGVVGPRLVNDAGEERAPAFHRSAPAQEYIAGGGVGGRLLGQAGNRVDWVPPGEVKSVAWIPGAAMLVKREVVDRVGGMDEGYFLYFEETDWLEAIGRAGFDILVDGRAVVEHIEGVSTGVVGSAGTKSDLPAYWYESWLRFWTKNRGRMTASAAALAFSAGLLTRQLRGGSSGRGARLNTFAAKCLMPVLRGDGR